MSQKQLILDYLMSGGCPTELEAPALFNCTALAQRIADLRRDGYDIKAFKVKKNKNYCRYVLFKDGVRRKY